MQPVPVTHGSRVSWFELFYDLVLVAAVLHGSKLFDEDPSLAKGAWLAVTLMVLLTIWFLTTLTFNTVSKDWVLRRLIMLVQMLAVVIASLSISRTGGLSDSLGLLALGVAFGSVAVLYGMKARGAGSDRRGASIVGWSSAFAALLCFAGAVLPGTEGPVLSRPSTYAFGLAVAVVFVSFIAVYVREFRSADSLDQEHLSERVGQLVLISLGESFVSLILTLGDFNTIPNPPFLVLTFVVVYAMWVVYFRTVVPPGIPHALGRLRAWIVVHYLLIFGVIGTAAGFSALAIVEFDDASSTMESYRLPLPLLYVMVTFAVLMWLAGTRWRRYLYVHSVAAILLLGLTLAGVLVFTNRAVTMGILAAVIVVVDASVIAWIDRRAAKPQEVS